MSRTPLFPPLCRTRILPRSCFGTNQEADEGNAGVKISHGPFSSSHMTHTPCFPIYISAGSSTLAGASRGGVNKERTASAAARQNRLRRAGKSHTQVLAPVSHMSLTHKSHTQVSHKLSHQSHTQSLTTSLTHKSHTSRTHASSCPAPICFP